MSEYRWQPWWRQLQDKDGGRTTLWWGEEEKTNEFNEDKIAKTKNVENWTTKK